MYYTCILKDMSKEVTIVSGVIIFSSLGSLPISMLDACPLQQVSQNLLVHALVHTTFIYTQEQVLNIIAAQLTLFKSDLTEASVKTLHILNWESVSCFVFGYKQWLHASREVTLPVADLALLVKGIL